MRFFPQKGLHRKDGGQGHRLTLTIFSCERCREGSQVRLLATGFDLVPAFPRRVPRWPRGLVSGYSGASASDSHELPFTCAPYTLLCKERARKLTEPMLLVNGNPCRAVVQGRGTHNCLRMGSQTITTRSEIWTKRSLAPSSTARRFRTSFQTASETEHTASAWSTPSSRPHVVPRMRTEPRQCEDIVGPTGNTERPAKRVVQVSYRRRALMRARTGGWP